MTMTSETAQELREGGSSKPRTIEYTGHTLKVGTIWFSLIVNFHFHTTGNEPQFFLFLNQIIFDLRQILKLKMENNSFMWVNLHA